MTDTNRKTDRTETRHCGKNIVQEGKRESLRDEIFEIAKEIVSVERGRERERERERERVGVHCEQQTVGAHVAEVAQVPGALLFHGSHSLSVKTAQLCRQLCSGGCGGERRGVERGGEGRRGEERVERGGEERKERRGRRGRRGEEREGEDLCFPFCTSSSSMSSFFSRLTVLPFHPKF